MPSRFSRYILQLLPPCNHTRIYPFHFVSLHIHSNSALAIKEIEYVFKFEDPIAYERCHPVFIYVIDLAGKPDPIMGKDTSPFDQCVERYLYSGQRIHYQIRDADLFMQFEELNWVYVYFASKTIIAVCRNLPSVSVVHGMLIPALSEIFRTDNCFFVHAAAVVKDSFGIMIAGPRASGKSTLAYNLGQNGYRIVSDDMVILDVNTEPLRVLACSDGMNPADRS